MTGHNGPQVNPTTSVFPLNNNNNNNKLISGAGSLYSSDSVEEENEIEDQSGRPIQRQIPQSQWGKAKTVLVENNLSTAVLPFQIFHSTKFANGAQVMWFFLCLPELTLISGRFVIFKMKFTKIKL